MRIIDITLKDLRQLVRDWKAATFLVAMPIIFTLLFGFAFGGFSAQQDLRLPVGVVDRDGGALGAALRDALGRSEVLRPVVVQEGTDLDRQVRDDQLAGVLIVPAGYSERLLAGEAAPLELIVSSSSGAGPSLEAEVSAIVFRLASAAQVARLGTAALAERGGFADAAGRESFRNETLGAALSAWAEPPVRLVLTESGAIEVKPSGYGSGFAHSSPSMMIQFAIAGLMGAGEILVLERKTRALQRLLTTAVSRIEIILGHLLTMFLMILAQLVLLILFGSLVLRVGYLREPLAVLLMVAATALWAATMGLLIGTLARAQEQVILFALLLMFILAALGGAWVPLEFTGPAFQTIGHFTPAAWAMDGFENIVVRGLGLESVLLPAGILLAYAVVFFGLAVWRFRTE